MRNENARLPGTAPSTSLDGYDMTVKEAAAMSPEEFERTFGIGLKSLGDVPVVHRGLFLDQAPRGCPFYVRYRPVSEPKGSASKESKSKARKQAGYELVVRAPQFALAEAGGGVAVAPKVYVLNAKDPKSAVLETLVKLARAQGRTRRATDWPIGRIQALRVADVLRIYKDACLAEPPAGDGEEDPSAAKTRKHYGWAIDAFCKVLPDLEVGDVQDALVPRYMAAASGRGRHSKISDLFVVRRSLKIGLHLLGVPPTYHCHFRVPQWKMSPKVAWTPAEYDRLCAAADGFVFGTDGSPVMGTRSGGPVQKRRFAGPIWLGRKSWRRAIPFLAYTASRHGRLSITRWVPPDVEPIGRTLRENDRPWLEVTDEGIWYHRDGEAYHDGNKRRGGDRIPDEFEPTVRGWYEEDLANGYEWVFHQHDGSPYVGEHLCKTTFKVIVKDAGIDPRRVPHHLKDLAVDWSDESGMDRDTLAAHADTTARMLGMKYGDPRRAALLERAAKKMSEGPWRERGERKASVARLFRGTRVHGAAGPVVADPPASRGRRRSTKR